MTYFKAVRLYSFLEAIVFSTLLVVWIGGLSEHLQLILGWIHGFGWIALCMMVAWGCVKRIFPWPLLAATVSPLGPLGAVIGFEVIRHQSRSRQLT